MIRQFESARGDFLILNENPRTDTLAWGYRNHDELAYHYGKTYIEALYFCDDPTVLSDLYAQVLSYMEAHNSSSTSTKYTNAANAARALRRMSASM